MPVTGIDEKTVVQICVIVRDIERTAARYAEVFGFDVPTDFQVTLGHDQTNATYYGQPTDGRARLTAWDMGRVQFELLQPLDAPSVWNDFLDQHGEGIHHIAFYIPHTDVAAASFVEHGYTITQQGLFTGQTGMYTYLDTDKDLGLVVELLEHFDGTPQRNGTLFPADKGIGTDVVCQVGVIVPDIERAAQRVCDVLGLAQPNIFATPGYARVKTTYNGQPSEATAKLAFFNVGQLQLELIEPDEKPSVWRDFLEASGGGAHHIAFQIGDTKGVTDYLAGCGIPVSQQGLYGDLSGMYTYMDSQAQLGTTVELLESFKK